jgi:methylmalonyl-CoA mutase N-terminal domain/subunit
MGGMVAAIEQGFPQREIQESAYTYQKAVERKEKIIVGVNAFVSEDDAPIETLRIDESVAERQTARLAKLRASRDNGRVRALLTRLGAAATGNQENLMPHILDCVRSYATLGEICDELRAVYGVYREPAF